jgi:hypothetical protein
LHAAQDLVDQATATFCAQATSFREASTTFGQLAGLMNQQADLLERADTLMRDPLTVFRSADDEAPHTLRTDRSCTLVQLACEVPLAP